MDVLIQVLGSAGGPVSLAGILLYIWFLLRKGEALVSANQIETIKRLETEIKEKDALIDSKTQAYDELYTKYDCLKRENTKLSVELIKYKPPENDKE